MKPVFADTYYYLALVNPSDNGHAKAVAFAKSATAPMVVTDWVITELADGLCAVANRPLFARLLSIIRGNSTTVVPFDAGLMERGLALFAERLRFVCRDERARHLRSADRRPPLRTGWVRRALEIVAAFRPCLSVIPISLFRTLTFFRHLWSSVSGAFREKQRQLSACQPAPPLPRVRGPLPRKPHKNGGFARFEGSNSRWTSGPPGAGNDRESMFLLNLSAVSATSGT